jgi:hypothetical protein
MCLGERGIDGLLEHVIRLSAGYVPATFCVQTISA